MRYDIQEFQEKFFFYSFSFFHLSSFAHRQDKQQLKRDQIIVNGQHHELVIRRPFRATFIAAATTSATTYKTQFRRVSASGSQTAQFGSAQSTITLLEIGA